MNETKFSTEQVSESYPPGIESHFWTHARNQIILREVRAVVDKLPVPGRVLEIGCGAGVVLRYLRDHGVDCDGVDPGDHSISAGLSAHVFSGIDCFQIPTDIRATYTGILLLDVIEQADSTSVANTVRRPDSLGSVDGHFS